LPILPAFRVRDGYRLAFDVCSKAFSRDCRVQAALSRCPAGRQGKVRWRHSDPEQPPGGGRDRQFESGLLQRGVYSEPHFRGAFHRRTEGRNPSRSKLLRQRTRLWHLDEMVVPRSQADEAPPRPPTKSRFSPNWSCFPPHGGPLRSLFPLRDQMVGGGWRSPCRPPMCRSIVRNYEIEQTAFLAGVPAARTAAAPIKVPPNFCANASASPSTLNKTRIFIP
jgi:hypothetical protein